MDNCFLKNIYGYKKIKEELYLIQNWYFQTKELGNRKIFLPKGILFYGNPGGGKTLIMREYAKSFGYPTYVIEGNSDNLEEEIVNTYNSAREEKNAIVIIDELDRFVKDDSKLTRVLQSQLDGYKNDGNVLTLATANSFYDIPEALLREGRFDRKFKITPIWKEDYIDIINGFSKDRGFTLSEDDINELYEELKGYAVSSIRTAFNNAYLRYGESSTVDGIIQEISFLDTGFVDKYDNFQVDDHIAIHEAGHALYCYKYCKTLKFLRVYFKSFEGLTTYIRLNENDTADSIIEIIQGDLAGLVAEDIIFGKHDSGCYRDLKDANSRAFDLLNFNAYEGVDFICDRLTKLNRSGTSVVASNKYDIRTAKFLRKSYKIVKKRLKKNKKTLLLMSEHLKAKQVLKRDELIKIIEGEK